MTIQLILASQSPSRRRVLESAGIRPLVRVSHVDESAVLDSAARSRGVGVDGLDVGTRVAVLARAKAAAVADEYRGVVGTVRDASGDVITAYPLEATGVAAGGRSQQVSDDRVSMMTRDFSGLDVPTAVVPVRGSIINPDSGRGDSPGGPLLLGCDSLFAMDGDIQGKPHTPAVARERLLAMRGRQGELWTGHTLVDLASGRVVSGTSHAVVYFGEYDDEDIDAYVRTGEPLEIAGAFTLEGRGGVFIDGVDGDPHGVLGLSLPLVRRLAGSLGVRWTDMWNAEGPTGGGLDSVHATDTPQDNVHQPGDGWVDCACGRRHWGLNGAAGVLLVRRDDRGHPTHVVMQHRAMWSAEGGTWGIPGGAIADGENAVEGALRESHEEAGIRPQDIRVVGAYREEHGTWAYTTVIAFEREGCHVDPLPNDDESMEIAWVPIDDVPSLRLLTAFRADWPRFRHRLDDLSVS
ncbi:Maf family protein [uncultured Bifidobacterium sp.]|uniref:Maf family protein n=1 Tax=uncultured Bifidobacterium sp. TaxID=165187 RepID=UPI00261DC906|nr:Maf family protein [uncultured Bifidobacterium sp.]